MSAEWLLADGKPFVDALVLSHPEQLVRLAAGCPEAAPAAVLAGDPCYDRMLAALPRRRRFRRALGVAPEQRLVLLNSTWNPQSLFGSGNARDVLPRLLARLPELPAEEYRVAAVLHPNIWYGHGPGQVRFWLDRACRAGLTLVDPVDEWRQALIAADVVIGDGGSVTYYAAAVGVPVLLGTTSPGLLAPDSPVGVFNRQAPRLDLDAPLPPQLERLLARRVLDDGPATPAALISSAPGRSAALLRALFYELIGLPEPPAPALLAPLPLPRCAPAERTAPLLVHTRVRSGEVVLRRYADPYRPPHEEGAVHTAVHEDTLETHLLDLADVIHRQGPANDPRLGPPAEWAAEVLARHPGCGLAAYVTGPAACTVRTRAGEVLDLEADTAAVEPAALASAVHAWLTEHGGATSLVRSGLVVRAGRCVARVRVTRAG